MKLNAVHLNLLFTKESWRFVKLPQKHLAAQLFSTLSTPNQHIIMISEGSCDTQCGVSKIFQCFLNKCFLYLPRLHLFIKKYCKNISIFIIYIYSNAIYSCDGKVEFSAAITLDLKVFLIPHSDQHSPLFHIPRRFLALALLDPSVG